ncbi:MAG: hypothetical protein AB7U44_01000 [Sulfuricurvum sp.]|nr:hypothetical protein [Sulfuricurvum sp.]MDD2838712.1 hypothetical protein [Sulfuricurvum sp.]MDD3596685.1 hypothetical protein [Sulfuricurvum sp.]MDD4883727.1 hypothetical protein [Sulfuricurvum sp.]
MKRLIEVVTILFIGSTFLGCSGNIEQYKPMNQVKPEKKPLNDGV